LAAAGGLALGAAIFSLALAKLPLFETLEFKTYDLRMRASAGSPPPSQDIVVVTIDEASIRALDPLVGRWPWPRLVHAQAVDFLARGAPRVVLYDVLFTEHDRRLFTVGDEHWTGDESDRTLAAAVKRAGNVVVMADVAAESGGGSHDPMPEPTFDVGDLAEPRSVLVPPFPELGLSAAAVGHNLVLLDPDGPLRRVVPFVRAEGRVLPSGSLAAALLASRVPSDRVSRTGGGMTIGDRQVPLVEQEIAGADANDGSHTGHRALVRFAGAYRTFSFYDLFYAQQQLLAGAKPDLDPSVFRDKIVVVGANAPGLSDLFTVPLNGKFSGAEVHASFIDNILSGRAIAPAGTPLRLAVLVSCAVLVAAASVWLGPWMAIGVAIAALAALSAGALAAFRAGTWLPLVPPVAALAFGTFGGTTYRYVIEGREKRQVKHLFSRFVSRDVYEQLLTDPRRAALGGDRREMTVLFCDIRGFTTLAERTDPETTVATLNAFFTRMVPIVLAHGGTIDKFVGDMIMALFGAPLDDPRHAEHAVDAALAMSGELDRFNAEQLAAGGPQLDIGIGINSGDMIAGLIGSDRILSYTVIGDAVNLGSRIESLNKQYGTRLIISDATRQRLPGGEKYHVRPLGDITVKGRSQPVSIFEVKGSV
jgi:adenylate cyclase